MKKAFTILIVAACAFQINPNFGIVIVKNPNLHQPATELHLPGIYDFFISNNLKYYVRKMRGQLKKYQDDHKSKNTTFAMGTDIGNERILPPFINYVVVE